MNKQDQRRKIVAVFEFNARENYQLERYLRQLKESHNKSNSESNSSSSDHVSNIIKDFKLFEPIMMMVEMNLNVKVVLFYRRNIYKREQIQEIIEEKFRYFGNRVQCDVANSLGDLWFGLFNNVSNFDLIHLFSSEKQELPETVKSFIKQNRSEGSCRFHYTGSSFKGYVEKVCNILGNQIKEIKDDKNFFFKIDSFEDTKIEKKKTSNKRNSKDKTIEQRTSYDNKKYYKIEF